MKMIMESGNQKMYRSWFFLLALLVFFSFNDVVKAQQTDQKFNGFDLQGYTDEGEKSWDIKGDTADLLGEDIKLKNVDANSFGKQKMNVTAETGTINQASGNMFLQEDVVVTSETGAQLLTDSLNWNKDQDLVTTDDDVYIHDPNFVLTGEGMESQPGLKKAKIFKNVAVRINTEQKKDEEAQPGVIKEQDEESQKLTITSDGPMIVDQLKSTATFQQNVVAIKGDQILKADLMEVYFDEEMKGVKEMICIGNVEIRQGENKSFAEKAVYSAIDQKLKLSGRPKLILVTEGENAITSFGN